MQDISEARKAFMETITFPKRETNSAVMVGIIGLVGSGKSTIAQALAQIIGATVIENDLIRLALRKEGMPYKYVWEIALESAYTALERESNIVFDADLVKPMQRDHLSKAAYAAGASAIFIRTICDYDVIIGRVLEDARDNKIGELFAWAKFGWHGNTSRQEFAAAVKLKEMFRRTGHHYDWVPDGGGKLIPKSFPPDIMAIDTTDVQSARISVNLLGKDIINRY